MTHLEQLLASYEQCKKAWFQAPTPRLGECLRRIEASIKYERSLGRRKSS